MNGNEIKQVIIIRSDFNMSKGKIAAQAAHASLMSYFEAVRQDDKIAKEWLDEGEKKIVLKVNDETSLIKLYEAFKFKRIPCALVHDAGLTEVPPNSKTALGIGPWYSKDLDVITGRLKLL
ncbi:peptidyl-tRNA hydrolase [Candidatus Mancarchaeum acidiphilum]|uniref:Peptidyl-tRNA hydrolase n=1 Tax=Candidatus Mancarchaeum acidiphilum TaxID=1920749 RepID=A0A218NLW6_9ARCH|nr:peptidyl-tRNA hydrolase Pth2 [Candidatus Mancarchaeum acidiphilum]ASI13456.1 peptidyl-tRNA hydrolase [Candidatus Mancarchaeum acidiphilum]